MGSSRLSVYYQHSKSVPFASWLSMRARTKLFRRFQEIFSPDEAASILDVGVTSDTSRQESNYFERLYPFPHRITCVGTEDGSHLVDQYPGLKYYRVTPHQPLPFESDQFDIAFSNAVLEHVGSRESQAFFLSELNRVCRRGFFLTTPNRWFPVEHHTGLPGIHFLPMPVFRRILKKTKYAYWADEQNLNILSRKDLENILPAAIGAKVETVTVLGLGSNLIAYALKRAA